jgi:ubiquitin C-terminal hydrolase
MQLDPLFARFTVCNDENYTHSKNENKNYRDLFHCCLQPFIKLLNYFKKQLTHIRARICVASDNSLPLIHKIFSSSDCKTEEAEVKEESPNFIEKTKIETEPKNPSEIKKPLVIKNEGNTCYLASVLQVLLALKEVREAIYQKGQSDQSQLTDDLINALKKLIETNGIPAPAKNKQLSPIELVREAIFKSKLSPTEFPVDQLRGQQDAASLLGLLMEFLIDSKLMYEKKFFISPFNITISGDLEIFRLLMLTMNEEAKTLMDLIGNTFVFGKQDQREVESLIELNGVEGKKAVREESGSSDEDIASEEEGTHSYKVNLKSLPDILPIHLTRFINDGAKLTKNTMPIELPVDGILDLSDFCDDSMKNAAEYELMGQVIHEGGSLANGHYVAYVKIDDTYWYCNDSQIKELDDSKKFYNEKQAYLLIFKRKKKDNNELIMNLEE